jgi:hypothetical protein
MIELLPHQTEFVYSPKRVTGLVGGRGCGKSVAGGFLIANRLTHGINMLGVAPTYKMLEPILIRETLNVLIMFGWHHKYNKTEKYLEVYQGGKLLANAYFRSCEDPETIRGLSERGGLVMDEAALCPPEAYDIAIGTLRGQSVKYAQHHLITTPRGKANWVSQLLEAESSKMVRAKTEDNTFLSADFAQVLRDKYSDDFARQEIDGEIIDATACGLFPRASVDSLFRQMPPDHKGELVLGFDVAGEGDDYSVIIARQGSYILSTLRRRTPTDADLDLMLMEMMSQYPATRVYIDSTGLGHFVPTRMAPKYPKAEMVGVNFGANAFQSGYRNRRTEIYFELKRHISNGLTISGMSQEERKMLEVELYATEYHIDNQTNFALVKKADIKKAIGRSPDIADALALSCANGSAITRAAVEQANKHLYQSVRAAPRR